MKKNFAKIILISSILVLLAAGCSNKQAVIAPISQPQNQQIQQAPQSQQVPQPPSTTIAPSSSPKGMTQIKDNAGKPDYTPGYVVVTQTVDGSSQNVPYNKVKDTSTAYDLLSSTHKVGFKDYGSMGKFVQSIDGVAPDSKHFWEFFVNGKSSNVGASSYTLKDADKIEWKLSVISASGE